MLFKFVGGGADGQEFDVRLDEDGMPPQSWKVPVQKRSGLSPDGGFDIYEYRRKQYVNPANNNSWFEYHH